MVDPKEVDAMKKLIAAMNGTPASGSTTARSTSNGGFQSTGRPEVDAMKKILLKFNGVADDVKKTLHEQMDRPDVANAMVTKTDKGARIGNYEIRDRILEGSNSKKKYDVVNVESGAIIAEGLLIYEAARGIVKLFNMGRTIMDPHVRNLCELEEGFSSARYEAAMFKKRARKALDINDSFKAGLYEEKFEEARKKAVSYNRRIIDFEKKL